MEEIISKENKQTKARDSTKFHWDRNNKFLQFNRTNIMGQLGKMKQVIIIAIKTSAYHGKVLFEGYTTQ